MNIMNITIKIVLTSIYLKEIKRNFSDSK